MRPSRTNAAAVPQGWNAADSIEAATIREIENAQKISADREEAQIESLPKTIGGTDFFRFAFPLGEPRQSTLIGGEDFHLNKWLVRDQSNRGTCNAFAVVAAEELSRSLNSGTIGPLSEEYLYAEMRSQPLPPVVTEEADKTLIEESGATFLLQAVQPMKSEKLFKAGDTKYDEDRFLASNFDVGLAPSSAEKVTKHSEYVHNIWKKPNVGLSDNWFNDILQGETVVSTFLEQIQNNVPVVASFALFDGVGSGVFTSPEARLYGRARYPLPSIVKDLNAVLGHTVCLVGFIPTESPESGFDIENPDTQNPEDENGWFVFRNSYGAFSFGRDALQRKSRPYIPAPGYGIIKASDVERYCWEYLYRA
ncbi:MAG: hypothetical protein P8Q99_07425 [Paracoccaceae bacterium]|nr:hypothetical protein [Paracoccaceae bacterium]